MDKQPDYSFCTKQFKPALIGIVAASMAVVAWTTYHEMYGPPRHRGYGHFMGRHDERGPGRGMGRGPMMPVATAPPIKAGTPQPHPDWGNCTTCHNVIPKGTMETPPKPGARPAAATMMVATAPPIPAGAKPAHPDWGKCTSCHKILGGANKGAGKGGNAATAAATAAPPIGIWVKPLTPAAAEQMGMNNNDGVVVSSVANPSPAQKAGIQAGDVVTRIDKEKIETVNDALKAIADTRPTDTIKFKILRNGRSRKLFVSLDGAPATPAAPVVAPAQPRPTPVGAPLPARTRIAVAVTSKSMQAQVAPAFGAAPTFVIYDATSGHYTFVDNPGAGTLSGGQQAVALLSRSGVGSVAAGNVGPGSFDRLNRSGIKVYSGAFGSVNQVVTRYLQGKLVAAGRTGLPGTRPAPAARPGATSGKVAVAAQGNTLESPVATNLSNARYLIVYDLATGQYKAVAIRPAVNPANSSVQNAHLVVDQGAKALIVGNVSPTTIRSLNQLGVFSFAGVSGAAGQAIGLYQQGRLKASTLPAMNNAVGMKQGGGAAQQAML